MTVDTLFSAKPSSNNFICAIIFLLETDTNPAALFSYPHLISCFLGWLQAVISEPPLGGMLGNASPLCTKSSFLDTIFCSPFIYSLILVLSTVGEKTFPSKPRGWIVALWNKLKIGRLTRNGIQMYSFLILCAQGHHWEKEKEYHTPSPRPCPSSELWELMHGLSMGGGGGM